jgi:hypothetical protein
MVDVLALLVRLLPARVAALAADAPQQVEPLLMRLDPQRRAKVLMALLGLVLVGVVLIAAAALGGRHVLRIARMRNRPTPRHDDQWYRKPLVPPEQGLPGAHEPE